MPKTEIRMLALSLTGRCNYDCRYCYASEHAPQDMTEETALAAVDLTAAGGRKFILQLTGGEPLLNYPVLKKTVEYVRDKKLPAIVQLQTNCSLMTDEIAEFLFRNQVAIGVSLDGRPAVNDGLRLVKGGGSASAAAVRGLQLLRRHNIAAGLTCVVTAENVEHLDGIIEFAHFLGNIRRIGFDLLRGQGRGRGLQPASAEQISKAVEMVRRKNALLEQVTGIKIALSQQERAQVQKMNGTEHDFGHCYAMNGEAAFVAADGRIYACSSFIGDDDFCLGEVGSGLDAGKVAAMKEKISAFMAFCRSCEDFAACGGGCYARWYGSGSRQAYDAECALKLGFACCVQVTG